MCFFPSELQKSVAVGLWQTGYYTEWLWCGQDGGGEAQSFSSRDLLLALGWLLATGALEKLLTKRVQQLDRTLLTHAQVRTDIIILLVNSFCIHSGGPLSPFLCQVCLQPPSNMQADVASLRKLQWLVGRLRFQGQSLLSMQEEHARLLHAVRIFFFSLNILGLSKIVLICQLYQKLFI